MNEQDRRVVENMALTGMGQEALFSCFPNFPKEEIEKICNETKNSTQSASEEHALSVNCS